MTGLPTSLWVDAVQRKCTVAAIPLYVVRKGAERGTLIVKIVMRGQGCQLLNQARDMDGNTGWMAVFDEHPVDEKKADAYIQRSLARDPDIWVVEVEDDSGKNPFEGKIF